LPDTGAEGSRIDPAAFAVTELDATGARATASAAPMSPAAGRRWGPEQALPYASTAGARNVTTPVPIHAPELDAFIAATPGQM
jgi:fructokinase